MSVVEISHVRDVQLKDFWPEKNVVEKFLWESSCSSLSAAELESLFYEFFVRNQHTLITVSLKENRPKSIRAFVSAFRRVASLLKKLRTVCCVELTMWGFVDAFRLFFVHLKECPALNLLELGTDGFPLSYTAELVALVQAGSVKRLRIGFDSVPVLRAVLVPLRDCLTSLGVWLRRQRCFNALAAYLAKTKTLAHFDMKRKAGGGMVVDYTRVLTRGLALNRSIHWLHLDGECVADLSFPTIFSVASPVRTLVLHGRHGTNSLSYGNAQAIVQKIEQSGRRLEILLTDLEVEERTLMLFGRLRLDSVRFSNILSPIIDERAYFTSVLDAFAQAEHLTLWTRHGDTAVWNELVLPAIQSEVERSLFVVNTPNVLEAARRLSRRNNALRFLFHKTKLREYTNAIGALLFPALPLYVVLRIVQFWFAMEACEVEQREVGEKHWHSIEWFADYLDSKKRVEMVGWLRHVEKRSKKKNGGRKKKGSEKKKESEKKKSSFLVVNESQ